MRIKDHKELYSFLNGRLLAELQASDFQTVVPDEAYIRQRAFRHLEEVETVLPKTKVNEIINQVIYGLVGLGPLEELLRDPNVSEIMVNGPKNIFVEKEGKICRHQASFAGDKELVQVINRIVGKVGRRIDDSSPLVDARLLDGSRVNAVIPPLSLSGPVLTIRKFPTIVFTAETLIEKNSISREMTDFLKLCVLSRQNMVISGGTGSGKTSTLNALCDLISPVERVVTIEDVAEIRMNHPHRISLESRPANIEGKGEISIRRLLKNALRMRPDRIIVGEIRSGEALDMLQAMNTGHKGSLTTVHANNPLECLYRIETMALMADVELPLPAIRSQINQGINVIVQQSRLHTGERKVTKISELKSRKTEEYDVQDIFVYDQKSGRFEKTGYVPSFLQELQLADPSINENWFQKKSET